MKTIKSILIKSELNDEPVRMYLVENKKTGMKSYYYADCFSLEKIKQFEKIK